MNTTDDIRDEIQARYAARLDAEEAWLSHFGAKSLPEDWCIHHEARKEAFLGDHRCRECDAEVAADARRTAGGRS